MRASEGNRPVRAFCLLVRLVSPFITDPAPVSVSTGHFETATNPLEQIRSLEQAKARVRRMFGHIWNSKIYKDKGRT